VSARHLLVVALAACHAPQPAIETVIGVESWPSSASTA
jgi:hypothetical protein